jgi:hypothetical protein
MPTPGSLFAGILFGAVGTGAFLYGKRQAEMRTMLTGVALIALPYLIDNAWGLYLAGAALCASLVWFRN